MEPDKWQTLIDKALQQARDEGKMSNLPGEGKPLQLEDDSHIPPELRMAHKLLKEQGFAPEWIMMGRELDDKRQRLLHSMQKAAGAYKSVLANSGDAAQQLQARSAWELAQQAFHEAAQKLNKEILNYNLKLPSGITHKPLLNIERELARLLA